MGDQLLIAYPPIQRNIKLEIPDEQQEVNTVVEEENWRLRLVVRLICKKNQR